MAKILLNLHPTVRLRHQNEKCGDRIAHHDARSHRRIEGGHAAHRTQDFLIAGLHVSPNLMTRISTIRVIGQIQLTLTGLICICILEHSQDSRTWLISAWFTVELNVSSPESWNRWPHFASSTWATTVSKKSRRISSTLRSDSDPLTSSTTGKLKSGMSRGYLRGIPS